MHCLGSIFLRGPVGLCCFFLLAYEYTYLLFSQMLARCTYGKRWSTTGGHRAPWILFVVGWGPVFFSEFTLFPPGALYSSEDSVRAGWKSSKGHHNELLPKIYV